MNIIKLNLNYRVFGYNEYESVEKLTKLLTLLKVHDLHEYVTFDEPLKCLARDMYLVGYETKCIIIIDKDNGSISIPIKDLENERVVNCLIGINLNTWRKFVIILKKKGFAC